MRICVALYVFVGCLAGSLGVKILPPSHFFTVICPKTNTPGSVVAKRAKALQHVIVVCKQGKFAELTPTSSIVIASNLREMMSCILKDDNTITLTPVIRGKRYNQYTVRCNKTMPTTIPTTAIPTTIPTTAIPTTIQTTAKDSRNADQPIVHLSADCPSTRKGSPILHLTADVPAYAKAMCKNGGTEFTTVNDVDYFLASTFKQSNPGEDCLFYKKNGSNTFTIDVEVGWGEKNSHVITFTLIKTVSCAYDNHGSALSSEEDIADWFLSPQEVQSLLGQNSSISFVLKVLDVLDHEIDTDHISIGRKIRLMATNDNGSVAGVKALSCDAKNAVKSYAVLRAGCGDGQVFKKTQGFYTEGNVIYSPYFDAFKLSDDDDIKFECIFTVCTSRCDGVKPFEWIAKDFYLSLQNENLKPQADQSGFTSHEQFTALLHITDANIFQ